jgi:hypothetical protein
VDRGIGLEEQFFKENRKSGKETKACQGVAVWAKQPHTPVISIQLCKEIFGYIGWWNSFLGIDSWAPVLKNTGSGFHPSILRHSGILGVADKQG